MRIHLCDISTMRTTKITIARLFNLGNFEHQRYEITVELNDVDSASAAIVGLEKILEALAPESRWGVKSQAEIDREQRRITQLHSDLEEKGSDEFKRRHGYFEGTPAEYIARCESMRAEERKKRLEYVKRASTARKLLDDLAGASEWKDHKLNWESNDSDYE